MSDYHTSRAQGSSSIEQQRESAHESRYTTTTGHTGEARPPASSRTPQSKNAIRSEAPNRSQNSSQKSQGRSDHRPKRTDCRKDVQTNEGKARTTTQKRSDSTKGDRTTEHGHEAEERLWDIHSDSQGTGPRGNAIRTRAASGRARSRKLLRDADPRRTLERTIRPNNN